MAPQLTVPYVQVKPTSYKRIKRPMVTVFIYSKKYKCWIEIENVLADTGADISILPKSLGKLIIGDIKKSAVLNVSGLSLKSVNRMRVEKLTARLGNKKFRADFAISDSDDIQPTLGRIGAIDKFDIRYKNGKDLIIRW